MEPNELPLGKLSLEEKKTDLGLPRVPVGRGAFKKQFSGPRPIRGQYAPPTRNKSPLRFGSPTRNVSPLRFGSPTRNVSPLRFGSPTRNVSPLRFGSPTRNMSPLRFGSPTRNVSPLRFGSPIRSVSPIRNMSPPRYVPPNRYVPSTRYLPSTRYVPSNRNVPPWRYAASPAPPAEPYRGNMQMKENGTSVQMQSEHHRRYNDTPFPHVASFNRDPFKMYRGFQNRAPRCRNYHRGHNMPRASHAPTASSMTPLSEATEEDEIREEKSIAKLSRAEMSKKTGLSQDTISKLEQFKIFKSGL